MIEFVNFIVSIGVLISLFLAIITLLALAFFRKEPFFWLSFVKKYALHITLLLAGFSTLGSLYYSEIAKFAPCKLCWLLRVFTYPQVILAAVALKKKDGNVFTYLWWLSGLALVVSLFHNYVYYFAQDLSAVCDTSASCTAYYFSQFGFVTIPFMGLGLAITLLTVLLVRHFYTGDTISKLNTSSTAVQE